MGPFKKTKGCHAQTGYCHLSLFLHITGADSITGGRFAHTALAAARPQVRGMEPIRDTRVAALTPAGYALAAHARNLPARAHAHPRQ